MKTIVVSGSRSNIGKTFLAEEMLSGMHNWSALKVTRVRAGSRCPRDKGCTVCSELKNDFDIIADEKIISKKDTDTARMKKAGAKKVIWLKANLSGLRRGLKKALYCLRASEGVVIEGTSVLKYIKPDLAVYLKDGTARPKPGAKQAEKKADIIIDVESR